MGGGCEAAAGEAAAEGAADCALAGAANAVEAIDAASIASKRNRAGIFIAVVLCQYYGEKARIMASSHEQIRRARAAHGFSQNELARRAGISRQALGAIEAGQYQPGVSVAIALARELGATVEALFGAESPDDIAVAVPASVKLAAGAHVALARVGGRVVAVPAAAVQHHLMAADGIVSGSRAAARQSQRMCLRLRSMRR